MRKPFGLMFEALDSLQRNEVYICSGASPRYALWGGLMSVRAMYQKAAGAVVNGYSRDTNEVLQLNFPTFSLGDRKSTRLNSSHYCTSRMPSPARKTSII